MRYVPMLALRSSFSSIPSFSLRSSGKHQISECPAVVMSIYYISYIGYSVGNYGD